MTKLQPGYKAVPFFRAWCKYRSKIQNQTSELTHDNDDNMISSNIRPMTSMLFSWSTPSIFDSSWFTTVSCTAVLPATDPRALQIASISSNMMMCSPLFGPICSQHTTYNCSLATSPVVSDCAQHLVASWTCHVINTVHSAVAHFLSPDQSSGTRFQTN